MVKNLFLRTLGVGVGSKIPTLTTSILRSQTPTPTLQRLDGELAQFIQVKRGININAFKLLARQPL